MIEFVDLWWLVLIAIGAVIFAKHGIDGLRTGKVSIPLGGHWFQLDDEYEKGETMFGLIVTLNFIFSGALAALGFAHWSNLA
jgi:hypothetical protein